jgi:hypothetical protein
MRCACDVAEIDCPATKGWRLRVEDPAFNGHLANDSNWSNLARQTSTLISCYCDEPTLEKTNSAALHTSNKPSLEA